MRGQDLNLRPLGYECNFSPNYHLLQPTNYNKNLTVHCLQLGLSCGLLAAVHGHYTDTRPAGAAEIIRGFPSNWIEVERRLASLAYCNVNFVFTEANPRESVATYAHPCFFYNDWPNSFVVEHSCQFHTCRIQEAHSKNFVRVLVINNQCVAVWPLLSKVVCRVEVKLVVVQFGYNSVVSSAEDFRGHSQSFAVPSNPEQRSILSFDDYVLIVCCVGQRVPQEDFQGIKGDWTRARIHRVRIVCGEQEPGVLGLDRGTRSQFGINVEAGSHDEETNAHDNTPKRNPWSCHEKLENCREQQKCSG